MWAREGLDGGLDESDVDLNGKRVNGWENFFFFFLVVWYNNDVNFLPSNLKFSITKRKKNTLLRCHMPNCYHLGLLTHQYLNSSCYQYSCFDLVWLRIWSLIKLLKFLKILITNFLRLQVRLTTASLYLFTRLSKAPIRFASLCFPFHALVASHIF